MMTASSKFKILCMVHVYFMVLLINDTIFTWSGASYYMSFSEFLPGMTMMITIFTLFSLAITGLLKILETAARAIFNKMGIKADVKVLYTWLFLVAFSVLSVKIIKQWLDSMVSVPYWNIIKHALFLLILLVATVITWKKREHLVEMVRRKLSPLFWFFIFMSVVSLIFVIQHPLQNKGKYTGSTAEGFKKSVASPNIILVIMDTMTARDMSVYGYERKTTPFLEEFAQESHLFTRFSANSNFTTPTVASIFTSRYPWSHQMYQLLDSIPDEIRAENLAKELKDYGYATMAFVSNPAADPLRWGIGEYFDVSVPAHELEIPQRISSHIMLYVRKLISYNYGTTNPWLASYLKKTLSWEDMKDYEFPSHVVFESFFSHVSEIKGPFFAWIHLYPPHGPYLPPEPYRNTYTADNEMSSEKAQRPYHGFYRSSQQGAIDSLRKRYDEFIIYCDSELKKFIDRLKENGLYDNSLFIFTSDHGEMFEKGYFEHRGPYLYEPLVHVPMIIHEPGQKEGTRIDRVSDQTDIAPTILDYAGIPVPEWMEGESFLSSLRKYSSPEKHKFSMWFEKNRSLDHPITHGTIAVFEGDYKLIHNIQKGQSELYNLRLDPGENNNLMDRETDISQRLESLILEKIRLINATRNRQH